MIPLRALSLRRSRLRIGPHVGGWQGRKDFIFSYEIESVVAPHTLATDRASSSRAQGLHQLQNWSCFGEQ